MRFALLSLVMLVALCYVFYNFLSIPYVHKSWTTKECLFVEYADGSKSDCKELPSKYELIWNY